MAKQQAGELGDQPPGQPPPTGAVAPADRSFLYKDKFHPTQGTTLLAKQVQMSRTMKHARYNLYPHERVMEYTRRHTPQILPKQPIHLTPWHMELKKIGLY